MHNLDDYAPEFVRMAGSCSALFGTFRQVWGTASLEPLGRLTAEALGTCNCRLADLDGYVSLVGYMWLPAPGAGYLVVDRKTLAAARADEKLADFIAALP